MDSQPLSQETIGKYDDKHSDAKFLEWCKKQEWLYIMYNCVNQTMNTYSKTPEYNRIQNLFLEEKNVVTLLRKVLDKNSKDISISDGEIKFEGVFNWDLIVQDYSWSICNCDWSDNTKSECDCELFKKYVKQYNIPVGEYDLKLPALYCEIKPCLGDEYTSVLRKMNNQIELTDNYVQKYNEEQKRKLEDEYKSDWEIRQLYNKIKGLYAYRLREERICPYTC